MALGKRLINTGAAAAACNTDSVQAFGADAAYSSNIALYQLDGNANDTTTNYNGTASNVTYATGHIGNAAVFNGSSSKIEVSDPVIPVGATSLSFWYNPEGSTGTEYIIGQGVATSSKGVTVYWTSQSFGALVAKGTSSLAGSATGSTTYSTTDWHNVVCTWDGTTNSNALKVYVNGSLLVQGTSDTSSASIGTYTNFAIGGLLGGTFASGSIDQVRIFDKAISAEDVATLYAETSSTASNTNPLSEGAGVALYSLDYDASEASGYYDGTPTNVEFGVGGKINYGARFNGSSSYIDLPLNTSSFFGGKNTLSLSLWFNTTTTTRDDFFNDYAGTSFNQIFRINNTGTGGNLYFSERYSGVTTTYTTSGTAYNDGVWHNVIIVLNNASNQRIIYIDGQEEATYSVSSNGWNTSVSQRSVLGAEYGGSYNKFLNGKIDQVRIFSKALNQTEVDTLFAETACVYTCTTDDVNYPTTNVAYYKLDNSSEDETGSYDGTESNIEYRFGRYGQAAVFNGSSSYITSNSLPSIGTGDFTFSCWFNQNSGNSQGALFSTTTQWFAANGYDGRVLMVTDDTVTKKGDTAYSQDTWNHAVFARESGVLKIYQNGTEVFSGAYTDSWDMTQFGIGVARAFGSRVYYFNGKIDQVRIYSTALTSSQVTELYEEKPCADTSNFKAVLYEGNGDTTNPTYISNVGIDLETNGGLVWAKSRTTDYNHLLMDSVRGTTSLTSNDATAERTNYNRFQGYEANGFSILANNAADLYKINRVSHNYVAWVFKGGGDDVLNEEGDIDSQVSANTEAGFSIVKWTSSSTTSDTIGSGLNERVEFLLTKKLNGSRNWHVWHKDLPNNGYLNLDGSGAEATPNDNRATVTNDNTFIAEGTSGDSMIAYCWHSVVGYSKIGTYEGDGTNDYSKEITGLGFDPSFVMVKNVDSSGSNWEIIDSRRGDEKNLYANESYYENANSATSYGSGKFITDGFEVARGSVSSSVHWNKSGDTYIYMAFK